MFNLIDPLAFFDNIFTSFKVWVSWTICRQMTILFAAQTLSLQEIVFSNFFPLFFFIFIRLVIDTLVLSQLTSSLILSTFSTTPPEFSAICAPMCPALPAEIFIFVIFYIAKFTLFYELLRKLTFKFFQFSNSQFVFFNFLMLHLCQLIQHGKFLFLFINSFIQL